MAPVVEESAEELDVAREIEEDKVRNLEHIKRLVVEFRRGNLSTVERWLSELDVIWVLHLSETDKSAGSILILWWFQYSAES